MSLAVKPATFELVIESDFAAPRAVVFATWTEKDLLSRWWAAKSYTILSNEMDVRPGGIWRRRIRRPTGTVFTEYGVYHEVVPTERLVFTYNSEGGDHDEPETIVTVTFADLKDGRTRLTLRHAAIETEASRALHERGWSRCFDRFSSALSRR